MVGGFVHQQAAAVAFFPVPAAKIVRAMFGIQQPFKVDRKDLADGAVHQQLTHFAVVRCVAVVERDAHLAARLFNGVKNTQRTGFVDGHRFFGDDIAARIKRAHDVVVMGAVHGGDDDDIGLRFTDHLFKLRGDKTGHRLGAGVFQQAAGVAHTGLVGVAESDHLRAVAKRLADSFDIHPGAPAGSHQGVFFHSHAPLSQNDMLCR